jgi:hypothetical protein
MATVAKFVQLIPIFLAYLVHFFKMVAVAAVAMETAKMLKN